MNRVLLVCCATMHGATAQQKGEGEEKTFERKLKMRIMRLRGRHGTPKDANLSQRHGPNVSLYISTYYCIC